jgi:hypothetical protein
MKMFRPAVAACLLALTTSLFSTTPAQAEKPKPVITVTQEGKDLHITIQGVTDYCKSDASTDVLRTSDSIRIVRERPSHVSRCVGKQDMSFVVKDVEPGRYTISYEMVPLVAPARPLRIAHVTTTIP